MVELSVCKLHINKANLKKKIKTKGNYLGRNKMIPEENMETWEEIKNSRKDESGGKSK